MKRAIFVLAINWTFVFGRAFTAGAIETSAHFVRVRDGKTLSNIQENRPLTPASVMKLVTTAALLEHFGSEATVDTKFYRTSDQALAVKGFGNPLLTSEDLWQVAADLKNLREVGFPGGVIIDQSQFDDEQGSLERSDKAVSDNAYDAPVSALSINFNTLALQIAPGKSMNSPALVSLDPYSMAGVEIENNLKTSAKNSTKAIHVERFGDASKMILKVEGHIPLDTIPQKVYRSIPQDSLWVLFQELKGFLEDSGIQVGKKTRLGKLSENAIPILVHKSRPLKEMVTGLNHYSNNFMADVLTKRLGADISGAPGTFTKGAAVLQNFLRNQVGIKGAFVVKDGSGLQEGNRLSAAQLTTLLTYMYQRFDLFPDFLASLPTSGGQGTLEKRFRTKAGIAASPLGNGLIRAKTGTLTTPYVVSSIAGFFLHKRHGVIAFAILQNGCPGKTQPSIAELHTIQEKSLKNISEREL